MSGLFKKWKKSKSKKDVKLNDLERQVELYKQMLQALDSDDEDGVNVKFTCGVCSLSSNVPQINACGHTYCNVCWANLPLPRRCPTCRQFVGNLVVNYALVDDDINTDTIHNAGTFDDTDNTIAAGLWYDMKNIWSNYVQPYISYLY